MSDLIRRMRHRRFQIKPDAEVMFHVELPTGTKLTLPLDNVSLTGLGVWSAELPPDEQIHVGTLVPAAKITFKDHEYTLGRMVLRTTGLRDGRQFFGFSCVDAKIPVDSPLSKHFMQTLEEPDAPFEFELSPDRFSMASFAETASSNVDIFGKVHQFSVFMRDWRKTAKFSYENIREASQGPRIALDRKRRGGRQDYIIMGSNDYLGLAAHPEVKEAAKKAIDDYGFGSTGSPVTTGITRLHVDLSEKLAKMFKKDRVVLFNSGYAANVGIISSLVQAQDLVVADMLAHASIQDAMQMSKGAARFFKHNSVAHLRRVMREHRDQYAGCLLVSEGVFSMDGDVAPVDELVKTAKDHKARLMIDEAHSFGVIGETGMGAVEKYNAYQDVDVIMGTFSKIGGGIGGFAAVSEEVADWLWCWARAHVFSVSIPPSTAAAALKAIEIFERDRERLTKLRENLAHFKKGLSQLGYHLPASHESAVVPVIVGDEKKLEIMNSVLMEHGVFVVPIVYPAVSKNNCRFRFTVMATHTQSDLDLVLNILEMAMLKADFKFSDVDEARAS